MHLWALTIAAFGNCCPEIFLNIAEKIEQDSLDSIPSKFNSLAGKFTRLEVIRQNIAGQQTFCFRKFVDNAQQCFAFTPQVNFPAHNFDFHWR